MRAKPGSKYPGRTGGWDFSPDGSYLVLSQKKDDNQDLYLIPLLGGEPVRLTTDPAIDMATLDLGWLKDSPMTGEARVARYRHGEKRGL